MRLKIYNITTVFFLLALLLIPFSGLFSQMSYQPNNENKQIFSDKLDTKRLFYEEDEYSTDSSYYYKGWSFGASFGFYFANKNTANFYNGSGTNDIGYILDNIYYKEPIEEKIGYDFDKNMDPPWELPQNMRYDPAMTVGFYAKYNYSKSFALFFQTTYVKLKTTDVFLLHLEKPQNTLEPTYNQYGILGMEERLSFDIGVSQEYDINEVVRVYLETGLSMNSTTVLKNLILIEDMEYSIINVYGNQGYIPNSNLQEFEIRQGGIGWGIFFGTGIRLVFSEHVSIDPGFILYLQNIVIKDNTNFEPTYARFGPSFTAFIRFTFKDFF